MRFWEIDFFRGLAIVLMIIFHFFFDLNYFKVYRFEGFLFWWLFPRMIAFIFIFLVGISLTISYNRAKRMPNGIFYKYLYRGAKIFSYGLIITAITWLFLPNGLIIFGILHFIGISIILSMLFLRFKRLNLFLGFFFILIGLYLQNFTFDFPWLLWLGFTPNSFYTFDYFPIFPWFGFILLGLFFGNLLYPDGKRKFKIPEPRFSKYPCFLGRHSLLIYLLHQPVIVAFLLIMGI